MRSHLIGQIFFICLKHKPRRSWFDGHPYQCLHVLFLFIRLKYYSSSNKKQTEINNSQFLFSIFIIIIFFSISVLFTLNPLYNGNVRNND